MQFVNDRLSIDLESLPSPPGVAIRLLELLQSDEVDQSELATVISSDFAMTAKIIKYCNSPLVGRPVRIESLTNAIITLGFRRVRAIALSFSLIATEFGQSDVDFQNFWKRSLATAICSQLVSEQIKENSEIGFLAGLVLDIGQLVLREPLSDKSTDDIQVRSYVLQELVDFENNTFGANRFEVGSQILKAWNFPQSIIELVERFSDPSDPSSLSPAINLGRQMATLLTSESVALEQIEYVQKYASSDSFAAIGDFESLFDKANVMWTELSKLLSLDVDSVPSLREIENEAKRRILSFTLSQVDEQQVIERENHQLMNQSLTDELTGLRNRRAFDFYVEMEFQRALRGGELAVAMIDIDYFKRVNDEYGHLVGDEALKFVSNNLGDCLRSTDLLCRYGGEEFALIMAGCSSATSLLVCERIRKKLESTPFTFQSISIPVTVSIGIAVYGVSTVENVRQLMEIADTNLYTAKNQGRNQCVF